MVIPPTDTVEGMRRAIPRDTLGKLRRNAPQRHELSIPPGQGEIVLPNFDGSRLRRLSFAKRLAPGSKSISQRRVGFDRAVMVRTEQAVQRD